MGVLFDYFRAPAAAVVIETMDRGEAGSPMTADGWPTGVVDAKGLDPAVTVGSLIGFIRDVPWSTGLVPSRLIWPGPADEEALGEHEGPWVEEFGDEFRDTLAGVDDARIPELAARWVRIEELHWPDAPTDALVPVLTELVALARAARDAGDHLYCWSCL